MRALSDLQNERIRARDLEKEVRLLTQRQAALMDENKRLRNLVGQACQDRHSLSAELRAMLNEFREANPDLGELGEIIPAAKQRDAA